ncbi:MAG: DUF4112 domain-containing protein [Acidimicrobiia bacterium]
MIESILYFLAIAFAVVSAGAIVGYFALRWVFMRAADRLVALIDKRVGGAAAHALTGVARFATARGIGIDEAQRIFGGQIDRLARLMDGAITLPILGRVGLDAVLDLVPVVGNIAGAAISMSLILRALQYAPPPALVSRMLSNVLVDVILGAIPVVGPLADLWFRANETNAALMREFLESRA